MSNQTKEERIKILNATQQTRKEETLNKVNKAIERLQKTGAKISFQSIAREANVSVPYLYKYPELKERIQNLRTQQTQMPSTSVNKPHVTAKAHSQVIGRLKQRIQQLETENKELKRKNEALAGQVYRVHSLDAQIERQQQTITLLEAKLKETPKADVIPITRKSKSADSSQLLTFMEQVKAELSALGISLNSTLSKTIKAADESTVLAAIEALKDQLTKGTINNPGGWLASAIKNGWSKPEPITKSFLPQSIPTDEVKIDPNKKQVSEHKLKSLSSIFSQKDHE